jgi:hypothetical protein
VFKDIILGNGEFQGKNDRTCMTRREMKIDVWKYIRPRYPHGTGRSFAEKAG